MTIDEIRNILLKFVSKYSITKMVLFGSRAAGTNTDNSDVDLIVEFSVPVSLIKLSMIKIDMEEALGLDVDIIHGPISESDMITVDKEVTLYAA
ncbi:MAG: nucleotidyltransferase domain-containing protein [Lachnospiraceae bacterium]|nr:nucleotidyltransferase domain-containing protein [Lachnospiraceae bacterium]